jgi:hypothetical protein
MLEEATSVDTASQGNAGSSEGSASAESTLEGVLDEGTQEESSQEALKESSEAADDSIIGKKEGEEGEQKAEETPATEGAPEKYEPFDVPEGFKPDEEATKVFEDIVRKHGLSQPAANDLYKAFAELEVKDAQGFEAAKKQQDINMVNSWIDTIKKDAVLGGAKYDESVSKVKSVFNGPLLDDAQRKFFTDTKQINNPDVFRLFATLHDKISDDTIVGAGQGSGADRSKRTLEEALS